MVVHELAHLIESSHNARFHSLMSQFMSNWKLIKAELNRLPISMQRLTKENFMSKKTLPIGIQNFAKIREDNHYR